MGERFDRFVGKSGTVLLLYMQFGLLFLFLDAMSWSGGRDGRVPSALILGIVTAMLCVTLRSRLASKGYGWKWSSLGLLNIVGLWIVQGLPDRTKCQRGFTVNTKNGGDDDRQGPR
jgi:hypothetical protein